MQISNVIFVDYKVTVWRRVSFDASETSPEEVIEAVKDLNVNCLCDHAGFVEDEIIYETEEVMEPEENLGNATIEVTAEAGGIPVWSNKPEQSLFNRENEISIQE